MIIDTITGNFRIDQIINIYRNTSKFPIKYIEVRYLSGDKWKIIPWSRRWWNSYEGEMKVCFSIGAETLFFKRKNDFWLKTNLIVQKFLAAGEDTE